MKYLVPLLLIFSLVSPHVNSKEKSIAITDETSVFMPMATNRSVDFFVEKVDGKKTKFGRFDSVVVDAGTRTLDIRLEYAPAKGSSLLFGSLGNLLLRATTNKSFHTSMTIDVVGGKDYQLIAVADGDKLEIIVDNHTDDEIIMSQQFLLKGGKFEKMF
ncbi:MAG: hypothetical protein V7720_14480 [Halioglobus sp.]